MEVLTGPVCHRDEGQLPRSICYICLKLMEHRGFMQTSGAGKGPGFCRVRDVNSIALAVQASVSVRGLD